LAAASAGQVGSSCVTNLNCNDDLTCLTNFLAGYCSRPCTADADCGEEAACADLGGGVLRCLDRCNDDAQCRFGYGCQTVGEAAGVCYPDTNRNGAVRNPGGAPDGDPCLVDTDCMGGTCITGDDFPDGYCSTRSCDVVGCATPDATCVNLQTDALCFHNCVSAADCREDYRCTALQSGSGVCYAKSPGATPMIDTGGPITVVCNESQNIGGNKRRVSFEIGTTAIAFSIVPYSPNDFEIIP